MAVVKRLVCLANSRKLNGRCVAGIELVGGRKAGWIRPVSAREKEEVSEAERQYPDGSDPCVLDVMDVPLLEPQAKTFQQENWLLDPDCYWEKVERYSWNRLALLVETPASLWIDGNSTYHGSNDFVPLTLANSLNSSLYLIKVDRLLLSVFKPSEAFGNPKRRVQGAFTYNGTGYKLWVTDPVYERRYLAKPDGDSALGECFMTISLGEPFNDACYKLIAAIFQPDGKPPA